MDRRALFCLSDLLQTVREHPEPDPPTPKTTSSSPLNLTDVSPKVYSKLDAWQTRVVMLEPGTYGDPLVVQLLPVDLIYADGVIITDDRTRISYEAVSYSWGHDTLTSRITCNGQAFPVNPNAYSALQRLRRSDRSRYLWLDAISINQHDSQEKSWQITQLFPIFKKASGVVVWLGEEDKSERLALDHLRQVRRIAESEIQAESDRIRYLTDLCEGLVYLGSKPWYRRVWV